MLKDISDATGLPLTTTETIRSPRQALSDKQAQVSRRLRLAYHAACELEQLAALLDPQQVTNAKHKASLAAKALAGAYVDVYAIEGIERLPTLMVLTRKRRSRRGEAYVEHAA